MSASSAAHARPVVQTHKMVVRVGLCVKDGEFALLGGSFHEEFLHCLTGSVCENNFVVVYVVLCKFRDLVVYVVKFLLDVLDAVDRFGLDVKFLGPAIVAFGRRRL